ncbi:MAG: serine hydrolase [Chloroflexota bacterium]
MKTPHQHILTHPNVIAYLNLISTWVQANRIYKDLPSISLGIVYDQTLIYARGFGYANIETKQKATPDSIYRIASHSKLFTAIALMKLRDEGRIDLDTPINTYLPWFDIQIAKPEANPITIRHLLVHISGLPREAGSAYWQDFDFPTSDQLKARLGTLKTVFLTETRWKYSNLGLTLAGEIVSAVSKQPYAQYVQENILAPLGMASTSVIFPKDHAARLAVGYGRQLPGETRAALPFVDAKSMAAATGFSSTITDMARFVSWLFRLQDSQESEILKPSTLREMQRPHWLEENWQSGRGLGFGIEKVKGNTLIGHGGAYPGYLTLTRINPQDKIGVIVFTNALDAQPETISNRIFEWITPVIQQALAGKDEVTVDQNWDRYTGTYRMLWTDYQVLPLDGKLCIIVPHAANPKNRLMSLTPISDHIFRLEGPGNAAIGEEVTFEMNDTGQAKRMIIGVNPAERITYPD